MAFTRTNFQNFHQEAYGDAQTLLKDGFAGDPNKLHRLLGHGSIVGGRPGVPSHPACFARGSTDDADEPVITNVATNFAVNLTTELGLTFPLGFSRDIEVKAWSQTDADLNFQHIRQTVIGHGTAPTLGPVINLGPRVGGLCTFANSGTDIIAGRSQGGFAVTETQTAAGRYVAAVPPFRRLEVETLELQTVGVAALTGPAMAHLNAATGATGVLELGVRAADDGANADASDTTQLSVRFDHLPLEAAELAIASAGDPVDDVIVGIKGIAATAILWEVEVYVGDLYRRAVTA